MTTEVKRRLAAILSADVAGYSRLMGQDDRATLAALKALRATMSHWIESHDGRVVNTPGDALLAEFPSAVEAVEAAIDIQAAIGEMNADRPVDRRMMVRIGVELGDVLVEPDGTIYGDGVNIAARLESLADEGSINLSGAVYDNVHAKVQTFFEFLGDHAVKNIQTPIRVYRIVGSDQSVVPSQKAPERNRVRRTVKFGVVAVILVVVAGFGVWQAGRVSDWGAPSVGRADQFRPVLPTGPSIAVLPFTNLSGDPEQDYFSDGLTADVIAALGRFANLSVMGRNTTLPYKDTAVAPEEIGRALGVRYVLDGAVRRAGDRIRVTAQLTQADSGVHLWSDRFDRAYENVFAVQDEITGKVAGALAVAVGRLERDRALEKPTENLEAYDYVLRGWALVRRETRATNFDAREMFERAVALDPNYSEAHAGIALTYTRPVEYGWTEFTSRNLGRAEELARRALALGPDNVAARRAFATVLLSKSEYDLASDQLRRALEVNPSDTDSYKIYGRILVYLGQADTAIEWFEAALRLDPKSESWVFGELGLSYYLNARYSDAAKSAAKAAETELDFIGLPVVAAAQAKLGNQTEAARAVGDLLRRRPFSTVELIVVALKDPEDIAHFADGLIKAGVPTSGAVAGDR